MGNYITLEVPRLKENDQVLYEETCRALAKELAGIFESQRKVNNFRGVDWETGMLHLTPWTQGGIGTYDYKAFGLNMYRSRLTRAFGRCVQLAWCVGYNGY